jgi:hypothetical protein
MDARRIGGEMDADQFHQIVSGADPEQLGPDFDSASATETADT